MSSKGVCRTAPVTLGLLNTFNIFFLNINTKGSISLQLELTDFVKHLAENNCLRQQISSSPMDDAHGLKAVEVPTKIGVPNSLNEVEFLKQCVF